MDRGIDLKTLQITKKSEIKHFEKAKNKQNTPDNDAK